MSQTMKALINLRELILNGELPPGERLLETDLVNLLGMSRTPIRTALSRLSEEGLLERLPSGGYTVRAFSLLDIEDAVAMRGTLEGMAARLAAERGVSPSSLNTLLGVVDAIDELLHDGELTNDVITRYFELNEMFHSQLVALAESYVVQSMIDRIMSLPFASPNAFVIAQSEIEHAWKVFLVAQAQHRGIVEAIRSREGTRAESLAREHAHLSLQALRTALRSGSGLDQIPGIKLIDQ